MIPFNMASNGPQAADRVQTLTIYCTSLFTAAISPDNFATVIGRRLTGLSHCQRRAECDVHAFPKDIFIWPYLCGLTFKSPPSLNSQVVVHHPSILHHHLITFIVSCIDPIAAGCLLAFVIPCLWMVILIVNGLANISMIVYTRQLNNYQCSVV